MQYSKSRIVEALRHAIVDMLDYTDDLSTEMDRDNPFRTDSGRVNKSRVAEELIDNPEVMGITRFEYPSLVADFERFDATEKLSMVDQALSIYR